MIFFDIAVLDGMEDEESLESVSSPAASTQRLLPPEYYYESVRDSDWIVPVRYTQLRPLGSGAFGCVCSSIDTVSGLVSIRRFCLCSQQCGTVLLESSKLNSIELILGSSC